jgi:hypothetical protein
MLEDVPMKKAQVSAVLPSGGMSTSSSLAPATLRLSNHSAFLSLAAQRPGIGGAPGLPVYLSPDRVMSSTHGTASRAAFSAECATAEGAWGDKMG